MPPTLSQAFQFRPSSHKDDFQIGAEGPQVVQGIQGPTEPPTEPPAIPPAIAVPFVPLGPTIESPVESPADHFTEIDSEEPMVPVSPENVKAASDDYLGGEGGEEIMKEEVDPLHAYLNPRVPQIMYDPDVANSQLPVGLEKEAEAWLKEHRKHQAWWAETNGETGTAVNQVVSVSDEEELPPRNLEKEFANVGPAESCSAGLLFDK